MVNQYGTWALIAGSSEGLGAAFAQALAARGMNLVLVARRKDVLEIVAERLRQQFRVEVRSLAADLGAPDMVEKLNETLVGIDIGMLVYNAAYAPIGEFVSVDSNKLLQLVDVNVRAPVALLSRLLPGMHDRKHGAVILMSSLAGNQGSPRLATYGASKAFNRVLAEGLWYELKQKGIDVIACCAGAIRTPGYASTSGKEAPGTVDPEFVVERTLSALGRKPVVIPGLVNQIASLLLGRMLPRRLAIGIMAASTNNLT